MKRSQAFKDYVLKRQPVRGNPFNFNRVEDMRDYTRGYGDPKYVFEYDNYGDSTWTYDSLIARPITDRVITPHEVVHSKIAMALFLEDL